MRISDWSSDVCSSDLWTAEAARLDGHWQSGPFDPRDTVRSVPPQFPQRIAIGTAGVGITFGMGIAPLVGGGGVIADQLVDTTARRPASQRRFPPCSPGILHRNLPFENRKAVVQGK